jgi:diadenosine tetraphosphatase ApaH/serine/threonine PP2A family protein phosphatase
MLSFEACDAPLILFGHTHYAEWYTLTEGVELPSQAPQPDGGTLSLDGAARYMVNPGSVGQPRDGNPLAAAGLYDSDAQELTIPRFSYDIAAVQRKIHEVGLPDQMALRLLLGI